MYYCGNNVDLSTYPFTNVIEGTIYNGNGNGKFGYIDETYGGELNAGNYCTGIAVNQRATIVNPMYYSGTTSGTNMKTCCFLLSNNGVSVGDTVATITNWYRVFSDITGV